MDKKQLTIAALAALVGAGSIYLIDDKGGTAQVELVGVADPEEKPLQKGGAHDEVAVKIAESAAPDGKVVCRYGVISNHPNRVYCENGTAGFLLSEAAGLALATDVAGWDDPTQPLMLRDDKGDVKATPKTIAEVVP